MPFISRFVLSFYMNQSISDCCRKSQGRERRSAFPTKVTLNDIGMYQNICVNIDHPSNSSSILLISSAR